MEIIGTPTIRPSLFYSGKIMGYGLWLAYLISLFPKFRLVSNSSRVLAWPSMALFVFGVLVCTASMLVLGKSTRLGLPTKSDILRTKGLYSISRNPIYVGFHLMTTASLMGLGHWYLVFPGFFSFVIYHLIILGEERYLEEAHGAVYIDYRKHVGRYF